MGNFLLPGIIMIRTWWIVLLGGINKHEQIQIFDLQIYFPVILTPCTLVMEFKESLTRDMVSKNF